ncbi:Receptor-type tyrosine-protein phosphatase-like N [Acipenser ruthenus]|uniref:Receptor-type tyrosine-protein phosphatase-like N n=1 Tax=Acipenser ruthenus TaxID=7906 RepID=A0A662YYK4_ACIRT|nr:Receptor-type tyrosine-protein phosphatase-like N [Acipenser ruthenus]
MDCKEDFDQRQLRLAKEGAPWCSACGEFGHLRAVCPYEDPLWMEAYRQNEVDSAEDWFRLKASQPAVPLSVPRAREELRPKSKKGRSSRKKQQQQQQQPQQQQRRDGRSDGAGRAGTYILIDMVLNRMAKGVKEIDIAATLEHIRDQRPGMVRTKVQYSRSSFPCYHFHYN